MANGPKQKTHFYASSGGNAGLACVVAARSLGHKATVVVPHSTKPMMIAKIKAAGASQVIQHGANFREADRYLREVILPADKAGVYVPPFDHPVGFTSIALPSSHDLIFISISGKDTQASSMKSSNKCQAEILRTVHPHHQTQSFAASAAEACLPGSSKV